MTEIPPGTKVQIHGTVMRTAAKSTAVRVKLVPSGNQILFLQGDLTTPTWSGLWENAPVTAAIMDPKNGVLPQTLPQWVPWRNHGSKIFLDIPGRDVLVGTMDNKEFAQSVVMEHNNVLMRVQQPGFLEEDDELAPLPD